MSPLFSNQELNDLRLQGDPAADQLIEAFARAYGSSVHRLTESLSGMIRMSTKGNFLDTIKTRFGDDENLCSALEEYFLQATRCPSWIDNGKLSLGERVFQDYIFSGIIMFSCSSLPICYVCKSDAKVLTFTQRFINSAPLRLVDTAQMITNVMSRGGISANDGHLGGAGIQSILKVRLIHASIRYLILNKTKLFANLQPEKIKPDNFLLMNMYQGAGGMSYPQNEDLIKAWQVDRYGIPINQESTALTLLTFSYIMLRGLKKIGVKMGSQQESAYLHSWNVIGYALGVNEEMLLKFDSYNNAEAVFNQIMSRSRGYSDDGELLQKSFLDTFSNEEGSLSRFKGALSARRLVRLTFSILLSKESYKALGLKMSAYDNVVRLFVWLALRLLGMCSNHVFLRRFADAAFSRIIQSFWGWEESVENNARNSGRVKSPGHKPLIIPQELIPTSYLSKRN
jgi:hypothetical protein